MATVGAVWALFAALAARRALREDDWRAFLGTDDWHSYALLQVGIDARDVLPKPVVAALYARAIDSDPHNALAQYNLSRLELAQGASEVGV